MQVKLIRLVGMMLVVFIRHDLAQHLCDVSAETVGTGILGMMVSYDVHVSNPFTLFFLFYLHYW